MEPGGYWPVSATAPCASAGAFCATASTSPLEGRSATIIAAWGTGSTAPSAARCTRSLSVECTAGTGRAGTSCSVRTTAPLKSLRVTTRQPVPAWIWSSTVLANPPSTCEP